MASQTFPANLGTGRVVGRFGVITGGSQGFQPAWLLTVTFMPEASAVIDAGDPVFLGFVPKQCHIDDEGYLVDAKDERGVELMATGDVDVEPHDWAYRVSFLVNGRDAPFADFTITLTEGAEVDLASVMPTPGV